MSLEAATHFGTYALILFIHLAHEYSQLIPGEVGGGATSNFKYGESTDEKRCMSGVYFLAVRNGDSFMTLYMLYR